LGGQEVWKDCEGARFGRMFSPATNLYLHLDEDRVCYIFVDYSTESFVHSITFLQIHILI
jgi:hypothetical protein